MAENEIRCSIITVSYNSGETIERTIKSVLGQTYKNIEYIIVDGASTDNTVDIIKQYEPLFKGNMRWVSEPDDGIYYAMNKGIEMASGKIVGIINSDDWYEEDAVSKVVNMYSGDKYQIIYGMLKMWRKDKLSSIIWRSHELLKEEMIAHPSCFVSKSIYMEFGAYDTEYKSVADYEFMLRMFANDNVNFIPIYEVIANFSTGGMSGTKHAWLELVRLQHEKGIISSKQYNKIVIKDKLYSVFHRA